VSIFGRFIKETRRRQLFGVVVIYVAAAWVLIQVADTDVIQDTLSVDARLVLMIALVGFPITLVAGWFYDITKKGVFRTAPATADESFDPRLGAIDFGILAMLAVVWIAGVYLAYVPPVTDRSIAVIPFENRSNDPDSEIFAFGVRDDLNVHLGRIGQLRVIASSSVDKIDQSLPDDRIAHQLGVAYLLKGSVERIADRIRVNVMLIQIADATQSWSSSFDRELSTEGLFDIRSGIANSIASALRARLTDTEQRGLADRPTQVFAAWEAFVRGRYLMVQRTRATIEGAAREFEKAVALDPDYAIAHAELAIAILFLRRDAYGGVGGLTDSEGFAGAAPHVEQAMALDPTLAEAHAATGFLLWRQNNPEDALTHFRQAIQINPNYSVVYNWMAIILDNEFGRYDEGFVAQETALRLDPLSIPAINNYVGSLIDRNRLTEVDRELEKIASVYLVGYASWRGDLSSLGGNWANAVFGKLDALRIDAKHTWLRDHLTSQFASIGLEKEALAISKAPSPFALGMLGKHGDAVTTAAAHLAEDPISPTARFDLGLALAGAGDYARARPILEELWQRSGGRITCCSLIDTTGAVALIAIRRDAGEEAEVGELVAAIRDNVRRYHQAGMTGTTLFFSVNYDEGLAAYLAGERERGLALIAKAVEDGYFIQPNEGYLLALYNDPGFTPIRARQEARQVRERERFLAIVCNENPYAAVWQPAEGTCERFAADAEI